MWVLLSSRIRTWLLLAVAVPVLRVIVHKLAVRVTDRKPNGRTAGVLRRADRAVTSVANRRRRRGSAK